MSDAAVAVLLFDGFEELDAFGPYDVLRTAKDEGAPIDSVTQVTVERTERVTASKGTLVTPHGLLDPTEPPDYLVVPGGGWVARADEGARAAAERGVVPDAIANCHDAGTTVASVCTGAMVLAHAELLDDRPATTHGSAHTDLEATEARVVDARVVDDGDVLTAGGVTAGLDLALWLVEREWGDRVATAVSESLEYDRSQDVYRSGN